MAYSSELIKEVKAIGASLIYLPSMALKKYPTFKNYFEEKE